MAQHNTQLKKRWQKLVEEKPKTRIRDAAQILNVSEMELLVTDIPQNVLQLQGDFKALMQRLTGVGKVMSLVRNEIAVHELSGIYPNLVFNQNPHIGVAMNSIDLKIHFNEYCYAFAVKTPQGKNELRSIQFFDSNGQALQKIYLKNQEHIETWEEIIDNFVDKNQATDFELIKAESGSKSFANIDVNKFRKDWENMLDVHDLQSIIANYEISRHEAISIVGEPHARLVKTDAINRLIENVFELQLSCMVFVGNKGATQIYSGGFKKIAEMGEWMNVLDPNFNLHVLNNAVNDVWITKKPTKHGIVTSMEVYDVNGKLCLQFSPENNAEKQESLQWRALLEQL